jgi:23S rRNA pseudouridine1911/1915/1917 synthase
VYADERIVVVDKRAGCLVHRTPSSKEPTLIDAVHAEYGFVHPVHRLDRFVSGLLVYGRDEAAAEHLRAQFATHAADRRYLAGVEGRLEKKEGTFRSTLRMEAATYQMRVVRGASEPKPGRGRSRGRPPARSSDASQSKRAITHWWTVEVLPAATLVEVALETGVKNQIRVHFAEAGHPILGEQKYLPPDRPGARTTQRRRLFLHAAHLALRHPEDGREVEFEAPLPGDLARWKGRLRHPDDGRPRGRARVRGPRSGRRRR